MKYEFVNTDQKPDDWPANDLEQRLENINNQVGEFKKDPNYKNKEILLSLISDYDLNQRSMLGLHRTTIYEVKILNSLYIEGFFLHLSLLRTFVYEVVGEKARHQKVVSWFNIKNQDLYIENFKYLMPQLRLYYLSYLFYSVDKDKPFPDKLIDQIKYTLQVYKKKLSKAEYMDFLSDYTNFYITLLNDISYFNCTKLTPFWAFSRDEIIKLYSFASLLLEKIGDSPIKKPLKGVLMTSISNYLLKSRNDYNEDYICKYLPENVAAQSAKNHEIWISKIQNLNDDREQLVIKELFDKTDWIEYEWIKNLDFTPVRNYYVSCFSKHISSEAMSEKYGKCIYGYKNDRLTVLLSPIYYLYNKKNERHPTFGQVLAFDVLYDNESAKSEINFLASIINLFKINENEKKKFLEEILQYWILSIKDEKWSYERERRYVIFMYDGYDYQELTLDDSGTLKLKSTIFMFPDFLLNENPSKDYIRELIDEKRFSIHAKPYIFCNECLNIDFDSAISIEKISKDKTCSICNSKNIDYINI